MQQLTDRTGDSRWRRDAQGNFYFKAPWGLVKHGNINILALFAPLKDKDGITTRI